MKPMALFDLIRHEPQKSAAIALIALAVVLLIFEWLHVLTNNPAFSDIKPDAHTQTKPKIVINESAPALVFPLFGTYVPANLSDMAIQKSTLDFEVVGILYSTKDKHSQVIIRSAGGLEMMYVVNDTLPGGVIIKQINPQGVVVLHNGVLEGLDMKKLELHFEPLPLPLFKE